ncbi:homeobox protein Mohawk isoform X3 [Bradysia coprophila]|nr:homeobox protein Mohawk isoform X3 [Bradysia coprophila]XP_037024645.1 homeobox protein Mohawk isoform X3 [Bradysia coprophila]XP_037024646.1 homeobox protein Mohawk isoform X3 [Bradysia coprophila]
MLKDWLVRRRDNPYPSREEKKALAIKTGLTYIQICNWFANWRRKLKNAGREPQKKTWGHLIKNYNTSANGNVEQFSICSSDSIWGDEERANAIMYDFDSTSECYRNSMDYNCNEFDDVQRPPVKQPSSDYKDCYHSVSNVRTEYDQRHNVAFPKEQCFQVSSTTNSPSTTVTPNNGTDGKTTSSLFSNAKYKNHIMEKYLRGLDCANNKNSSSGGVELSKWLESAANFQPNKNNYIEWESNRNKTNRNKPQLVVDATNHEKEELEAAEALTSLAGNYRNRMIEHS